MPEYELYHYGVKGMKWGVRKATRVAKNVIDKRMDRIEERHRSIGNTVNTYGTKSAVVRSVGEFAAKRVVKGVLAKAINQSANNYIMNSSNMLVAKGADYARRAAILGLSVSARADTLQMYADMASIAMHTSSKRREARRLNNTMSEARRQNGIY